MIKLKLLRDIIIKGATVNSPAQFGKIGETHLFEKALARELIGRGSATDDLAFDVSALKAEQAKRRSGGTTITGSSKKELAAA